MKGRGKKAGSEGGWRINLLYLLVSAIATFVFLFANEATIKAVLSSSNPTTGSHAKSNDQVTVVVDVPVSDAVSSAMRIQPGERMVATKVVDTKLPPSSPATPQLHKESSLNPVVSKKKVSQSTTILDSSIHCPKEVADKYNQVPGGENGGDNMAWCQEKKSQHRVSIGRSWGSLSRGLQKEWDARRCNELLSMGKLQTCSEQWGWTWFDLWRENLKAAIQPAESKGTRLGSEVQCIVDYKTTTYCDMRNAMVDFSKMSNHGSSRDFRSGFLTLFGTRGANFGAMPPYPGLTLKDDLPDKDTCDIHEHRPTFILSNDDIYNLGHYNNDLLGIWAMTVLANIAPADSLLINVDGYREGGPAGGGAHRMMVPNAPDSHGPYSSMYYHRWFDGVTKAQDYASGAVLRGQGRSSSQRVCFDNLYIFPLPGVPWFWNDWGRINECSLVAASPLYQSFNVYLRQRILDTSRSQGEVKGSANDVITLQNPPTDHVHIVIEVRQINPAKGGAKTATGRYIRNLPEMIAALQKIPNVRVTAQDFAKLSFAQQIQLAHSASILISMHGAGTTHIFHMALGQPHCCGLLELFPDRSVDLYTAEGYGNLARMLGLHHYRLVASTGSSTPKGTFVDTEGIRALAEKLVLQVTQTPTCLHDTRDTRAPLYTPSGHNISNRHNGVDTHGRNENAKEVGSRGRRTARGLF